MTDRPSSWDSGLESLLNARSYNADIQWSERLLNGVADTKTFTDAINRQIRKASMPRSGEDPSRVRENHVRHMILEPLSPRKPVIIPCPYAAVKQRDKQKLEKVYRNRPVGSQLRKVRPPDGEKQNTAHVRAPTVAPRGLSSMASRKRVFYWGV
jgi:hypothetical protein